MIGENYRGNDRQDNYRQNDRQDNYTQDHIGIITETIIDQIMEGAINRDTEIEVKGGRILEIIGDNSRERYRQGRDRSRDRNTERQA